MLAEPFLSGRRRREGVFGPHQVGVEHREFGWRVDFSVFPEGDTNKHSVVLDCDGVCSSRVYPGN